MQREFLILGLDPGTTIGLALIDKEGKIIHISSKRDSGLSEAISIITSKGIPLCIGTDKAKIPKSIKSISTIMGIKSYHPDEDMTFAEKKELITRYEEKHSDKIKYSNAHEYDSICCALYAYHKSKKLLEKLKTREKEIEKNKIIEFYRRAFSEDIPIHRLIQELNKKEELKKEENVKRTIIRHERKSHSLDSKKNIIDEMHNKIVLMEQKLSEQNRTIKNYETKIEVLRKRIKLLEKKDRKNLMKENNTAKKKDFNSKLFNEFEEILKNITSEEADILKISDRIYDKIELKDNIVNEKELKIVFDNKKYGIIGYRKQKKTFSQAKKDSKIDLKEILEEHKTLRKIAKENENRK